VHFENAVAGADNILQVVQKYEQAVGLRTSDPRDEEKPFGRFAPSDRIAITPTQPDAWMLGAGLVVKSPWQTRAVFLLGVRGIMLAYEESRDSVSPTVVRISLNNAIYIVTHVGHPRPIQQSYAQALVQKLSQRNVKELEKLWIKAGIIEEKPFSTANPRSSDTSDDKSDDGIVAPRVDLAKLHACWGEHCVAIVRNGDAQGTCWRAAKTGHCPQVYSSRQIEKLDSHVGTLAQDAAVGVESDRQGDAQPQSVPIDRSARPSRARRAKYLLGNKAAHVPEDGGKVMEALATDGTIPVTTLKQRQQCARARMEVIVPNHLKDAQRYGHIRPQLPPPAGGMWAVVRAQNPTWRLLPIP
jgi:hypothetical protein